MALRSLLARRILCLFLCIGVLLAAGALTRYAWRRYNQKKAFEVYLQQIAAERIADKIARAVDCLPLRDCASERSLGDIVRRATPDCADKAFGAGEALNDAWENPWLVRCRDKTIVVWSHGPDRMEGTDDDIAGSARLDTLAVDAPIASRLADKLCAAMDCESLRCDCMPRLYPDIVKTAASDCARAAFAGAEPLVTARGNPWVGLCCGTSAQVVAVGPEYVSALRRSCGPLSWIDKLSNSDTRAQGVQHLLRAYDAAVARTRADGDAKYEKSMLHDTFSALELAASDAATDARTRKRIADFVASIDPATRPPSIMGLHRDCDGRRTCSRGQTCSSWKREGGREHRTCEIPCPPPAERGDFCPPSFQCDCSGACPLIACVKDRHWAK
jgi:hypothetical protein